MIGCVAREGNIESMLLVEMGLKELVSCGFSFHVFRLLFKFRFILFENSVVRKHVVTIVGGWNFHFELNVLKPMIANALLHVSPVIIYCYIFIGEGIVEHVILKHRFIIGGTNKAGASAN